MNKYVKNMLSITGIVILFLLLSQSVSGPGFGAAQLFFIVAGVYAIFLNYRELSYRKM